MAKFPLTQPPAVYLRLEENKSIEKIVKISNLTRKSFLYIFYRELKSIMGRILECKRNMLCEVSELK